MKKWHVYTAYALFIIVLIIYKNAEASDHTIADMAKAGENADWLIEHYSVELDVAKEFMDADEWSHTYTLFVLAVFHLDAMKVHFSMAVKHGEDRFKEFHEEYMLFLDVAEKLGVILISYRSVRYSV